jgi:tetratricopeptide (TPR) repeat protein
MSSRHRWSTRLFTSLLLCLLAIRTARADDVQEARAAFEQGVAASRESRWEEARAQFQRSLELLPKASTLFNLALADVKLGRGRDALDHLSAFERAATPSEHAEMLERAKVLRPQAEALVASEQEKAQSGGNALSRTNDGLTDETRREVERAREDYAQGRDREALAAFEHAYRASKQPELLYNIGVVADRMRADARAIRAYEAFVASLPDAPEAAVAQVRSEALREALLARENGAESGADEQPLRAVEPAGAATDPNALRAPRALIVVGSLFVAASGGTLAWFFERNDKWDRCSKRECLNESVIKRQRAGALAATAASATLGVALTTAGAVMFARRKGALRASAFTPWLSPQLVGLSVEHAF